MFVILCVQLTLSHSPGIGKVSSFFHEPYMEGRGNSKYAVNAFGLAYSIFRKDGPKVWDLDMISL